jgi:RimJ/RimL family protein N-acetyltransferase
VAAPIPYPDPPLSGTDFVLRPYREKDVRPDTDASEDPASARWINSQTTGDAAEDIRLAEADRVAGEKVILTIADRDDDRYLGAVVLIARGSETGELAYLVAPEARGRGLAPRAVRLVSEWAFAELGLERLQLRIAPENEASHAVARRAGFQPEGLLRSAFAVRGRRHDVVMYSRLPSDLLEQ